MLSALRWPSTETYAQSFQLSRCYLSHMQFKNQLGIWVEFMCRFGGTLGASSLQELSTSLASYSVNLKLGLLMPQTSKISDFCVSPNHFTCELCVEYYQAKSHINMNPTQYSSFFQDWLPSSFCLLLATMVLSSS